MSPFVTSLSVFEQRLPEILIPNETEPELEVCYDRAGRWYKSPTTGLWYPSITTVLKMESESAIARWRKRVGDEAADAKTNHACERGTAAHDVLEQFCRGTEIPSDHEEGLWLAAKIVPTLRKRVRKVHRVETQLWSDTLKIAGRMDLLCTWDDHEFAVPDFKTSDKPKPADWVVGYRMQTLFYSIALWQRYRIKVTKTLILLAHHQADDPRIFEWPVDGTMMAGLMYWRREFTAKYGDQPVNPRKEDKAA